MLTFHNDQKVKDKFLARMRAHAEADEIIQGEIWENGKGCFVGCTLHEYDHEKFESREGPGLPEWLAHLADTIFEGLSVSDAKTFAADFYEQIPVGVELDIVKWKFCSFILKENIERVLSLSIDHKLRDQMIGAIRECLSVHEEAIKTGFFADLAAESARSAESTSESTSESTWSAADLAAESAWSAAWSTAWSTAWSATWSAALSAAEFAAFKRYADELFKLFREIGVEK